MRSMFTFFLPQNQIDMRKSLQRIAIIFTMVAFIFGSMTNSIAQSPAWGQCGGDGYTGPTSCVSGSFCEMVNPYYSQCIPGPSCPSRCSGGGCGATQCTITAATIPGTGGGGASKSVTAGDGYFACCYSDVVTIYARAFPNSCCPLD